MLEGTEKPMQTETGTRRQGGRKGKTVFSCVQQTVSCKQEQKGNTLQTRCPFRVKSAFALFFLLLLDVFCFRDLQLSELP